MCPACSFAWDHCILAAKVRDYGRDLCIVKIADNEGSNVIENQLCLKGPRKEWCHSDGRSRQDSKDCHVGGERSLQLDRLVPSGQSDCGVEDVSGSIGNRCPRQGCSPGYVCLQRAEAPAAEPLDSIASSSITARWKRAYPGPLLSQHAGSVRCVASAPSVFYSSSLFLTRAAGSEFWQALER